MKKIKSGSLDCSIKLWNLSDYNLIKRLTFRNICSYNAIDMIPNSDFIISMDGQRNLEIWNWKTGMLVKNFTDNRFGTWHMIYLSNGIKLLNFNLF